MKKINKLRLLIIDLLGCLQIRKVLTEYRKDQYISREDLDFKTAKKLHRLFCLAKESAPYYAQFDSYKSIPVLNKKIINHDPSSFLSSFYKDKIIKKTTSGSTGTPFTYYTSLQGQSHLWAGLLLSWETAGYQCGDKVAFVAGNALIKKRMRNKIFYKMMNIDLYPVAIMTPDIIGSYIQMIRKEKTSLIYGYAMAVNYMAEYILENKILPPSSLKAVICTSEMLTESTRANIERAFGVPVYNQYGCNEAGLSAFECGQHCLHIINSRSAFEISEEGNLIGTDLANEAFILMKYDTGDLVEFSPEPCKCGRSYPVITKIIGRSADVIIDQTNQRIHTTFFTHLFQKNPSIKQFQVTYDDWSFKLNLLVDLDFSRKDYIDYMKIIKNNLVFEKYDITVNEKFYSTESLKHTFVVDRRSATKNPA